MCPCIRVYACITSSKLVIFFKFIVVSNIISFSIVIYRISINDENNHVNGKKKNEVREK